MHKAAPLICAAIVLMAMCAPAHADLILNFNEPFPGKISPSGSPPWLTADFQNVDNHTVDLVLTSHLNSSSEFISGLFFNFDPTRTIGSLHVSHVSGVNASSTIGPQNCCNADGDGNYDIVVTFPTANNSRFTKNSTATFRFTYAPAAGISPDSFNFTSQHMGGEGEYTAAAHVQGIGSDSTWIDPSGAVPEPKTIFMFLTAGAGLIALGRRR